MVKTMSDTEARTHFGEVLDQVERDGSRIIIERDGKPTAMLISLSDDKQFKKQDYDPEELIEQARLMRKEFAEWRAVQQPADSPFPDWAEMIREMRSDRDDQLFDNLRRRERSS